MRSFHRGLPKYHSFQSLVPIGIVVSEKMIFLCIMGTNGQLFPLTDGTAVDQVQQQHLFISKLYRLTLG